jgi:hypothetical protein
MDPKLKQTLLKWADLQDQYDHEFVEHGQVSPRLRFSLNRTTQDLRRLIETLR